MSETIAGDIRWIRKRLRPVDVKGIEVKCNYGELLIMFDAIETKAKDLRDENAELKKCIKGACERLDLGAEPCTDCPYAEIDWLKDEKAKLKDENAKLKAALKPVLDIVMDDATSDLAMAEAIDEAHRIYKEGASNEKL